MQIDEDESLTFRLDLLALRESEERCKKIWSVSLGHDERL